MALAPRVIRLDNMIKGCDRRTSEICYTCPADSLLNETVRMRRGIISKPAFQAYDLADIIDIHLVLDVLVLLVDRTLVPF